MFGYVKAYKPLMRVCEYDLYKGIYCGLCKTLSKRSGAAAALTLSYDFVFLAVMSIGLNGRKLCAERKRCPVHPIKKTLCVSCVGKNAADFDYCADAAVILTFHKLRDDLFDKGLKSRLLAAALLPFYLKPYKRAAQSYPYLARSIEDAMREQRYLEQGSRSLDRLAEPTAKMMAAVFRELGGYDPDMRDKLSRFGYLLGRYVYICDAIDDLCDDARQGNYNPLRRDMRRCTVSDEEFLRSANHARDSLNLTLGELAEVYSGLELNGIKEISDNIVYLGLKNTFTTIINNRKKESERR